MGLSVPNSLASNLKISCNLVKYEQGNCSLDSIRKVKFFLHDVMLLEEYLKEFFHRTSTGVSHHQWWTFEPPYKRSKWPPNLKVLIEHICNQKRGQFIREMWLPLARPSSPNSTKTYQNLPPKWFPNKGLLWELLTLFQRRF